MQQIAKLAKTVSPQMAMLSTKLKNDALKAICEALLAKKDEIVAANLLDLENAKKEQLPRPIIKRLEFNEKKLQDTISGMESLIRLEDPVGKTLMATRLDDGLDLFRISCPIGVIGVIFESRPDALLQISSLCLKSGNCVLLKGGREAANTNQILFDIFYSAAVAAGVPEGFAALMHSREDVNQLLALNQYIDLIIPRGSNEFVQYIMRNTSIPVLGHADGICHCYLDKDANLAQAIPIIVDAKTQYVSVCNATETLLVHEKVAQEALPLIKEALQSKQVELVGCEETVKIIDIPQATEADWKTEYLDYKLSIKVVPSLQAAIDHINKYGSGHTDAILTTNKEAAQYFMNAVDSGNVFWNCSTRFSDGFRYGFGAEVGISTNKIHARGPVGLEGLLIYKYKLIGSGNTVAPYASGEMSFKHAKIDGDCPI